MPFNTDLSVIKGQKRHLTQLVLCLHMIDNFLTVHLLLSLLAACHKDKQFIKISLVASKKKRAKDDSLMDKKKDICNTNRVINKWPLAKNLAYLSMYFFLLPLKVLESIYN